MPNWNEIELEIEDCKEVNPEDFTRNKYLRALHVKTKRNVIAYYSGFLQNPMSRGVGIDDNDMNGFMNAISILDKSKGLDLILHTPGGNVATTESLVHYFKEIFKGDVRVIVPQKAMSAGTMISCSSKEIIMGKHSSLGPIDPQFNGLSAEEVIAEFDRAIKETKEDPSKIPIWQEVVKKYHPTFIGDCKNAIEWSKSLVKEWLMENMFKGDENPDDLATSIVEYLSNHKKTKSHSRPIHYDLARTLGLKITLLEDDKELQDIVLSIHHSFMYSFDRTKSVKIIENHLGNKTIANIK